MKIQFSNSNLDAIQLKTQPLANEYYDKPSGQEPYRLYSYLTTFFNNVTIIDVATKDGCSSTALSYNDSNKVLSYSLNAISSFKPSNNNVEYRDVDPIIDFSKELVQNVKIVHVNVDQTGEYEQKIIQKLFELGFSGIIILDNIYHPDLKRNKSMKQLWETIQFPKIDATKYGHWSGTGIIVMNADIQFDIHDIEFVSTSSTLEHILMCFRNKKEGMYLRFGDGDFVLATGGNDMLARNTDRLQFWINEAMKIEDNSIMTCVPHHCDALHTLEKGMFPGNHEYSLEMVNKFLSILKKNKHNIPTRIYTNIALSYAAKHNPTKVVQIHKELHKHNIIFIGNNTYSHEFLRNLFGKNVDTIYTNPRDAFLNHDAVFDQFDTIYRKKYEALDYFIIVMAAGCAGRAFSGELYWKYYNKRRNFFVFDYGSLLDFFSGHTSREYMKLDPPESIYITKSLQSNAINIKYYLIHGIDKTRKSFMERQFADFGIDEKEVTWLSHPNKNELTREIISQYCGNPSLTLGQISCTIKHYFAIQDIVKNQYELAVIMEDNVGFKSDVPFRLYTYLQHLPKDWDVLFDSDWKTFSETKTSPDITVYKKSNEVTNECHGGSRLANFIFINLNAATKLWNTFLPFTNVSDWHYNDLLRKNSLQSYWSEPANTYHVNRPSTV